jgi:hypothetical protein
MLRSGRSISSAPRAGGKILAVDVLEVLLVELELLQEELIIGGEISSTTSKDRVAECRYISSPCSAMRSS